MGAGASAPTGVGSSPAPVVAPPVSTPIATPTATPSSTPQGGKGGNPTSNALPEGKPFRPPLNESGFGDPRGFNNGATPALNTQASSAGAAALGQPNALTAPQQPYVNPFMQTYGQNNTPQQQAFNRFQPQQYGNPYGRFGQGFPQQGNFGQQRGFMPQNRGGYERQMDQLRGQGQYGQQYPQKQLGFMSDLMSGREQPFVEPAYNGPTQAQWGQMQNQPVTSYEARPSFGESQQTGVSQLNPFQAALVKGGTPYVQGAPGAPYAIGQGIPGGAPGGYMPLMNSNGTPVSSLASANPAGGKGGNPTSNVPISTYI